MDDIQFESKVLKGYCPFLFYCDDTWNDCKDYLNCPKYQELKDYLSLKLEE